jgi:hypothetical protein
MTRSAWRGRDGHEGKEGGGKAEKRRVTVERMPVDDDPVPERERGRERFSFWGVRWGGGDGFMEFVVRIVLAREEILAARRASWSWFSV